MKKKILLLLAVTIGLGASGAAAWYFGNRHAANSETLTLYGNVDIRQVQLAFNGSERIAKMLVKEGDRVNKGQLLAMLDTATLQQKVRKAEADSEAARLAAVNAASTYRRTRMLVDQHFVAQQQADDARTASDAAHAGAHAAQAGLELARRALADASLYAPDNGIIQERILEPGDMASPQRPVYTLAMTDPLWVRAYVKESDLGRIRPGMHAAVATDSYPNKRYNGWLGYISPTAEFTPKSVETTEVRSSLVYQVRIFVCNPQGELRLGMPATVTIALGQPAATNNEHCRNP
ncbi:efflux RND transporter periplasmic adaptor subunit [Sideroxydans lithotrophicus]|uniref:Efflux transporter, RND family, MFP subunit n=1 Tax=Sideroxydans lithotrophicus (strain ES-1) TaxID=580332 RepID=D5CN39_SIDLE|nr:efflux RND transporter periplasmic adaptor subunit [Sideroxydans lithotrophicus]ADE12736.1 efflux transporter, RND family, MFP subunit [Sideroxydans lithotrophicus ES-1]